MAKEPDCTKGYGARKLVYSLQQRFVGLSKDKIQVIFNCDKCDYRQNLRILNRAKLKPIRGMRCLYQTSRSSYGYGNYKSQWSFLSIDICYQSWMCSVGLYGAVSVLSSETTSSRQLTSHDQCLASVFSCTA